MDMTQDELQKFILLVEKGKISVSIDRLFTMEQIVEAHEYMEENKSKGKLVVLT